MDIVPVALLVVLGGAGAYVVGRTAVEQKIVSKRTGRKYDDYGSSSELEDVVAFAVAMAMMSYATASTPDLVRALQAKQAPIPPAVRVG